MKDGPDIAAVAALIGDPARANMLTALMDGRALTGRELAAEAGITVQTASSHLRKLEQGGLLRRRKQGRHTYVSLADADVADVLERLMGLAQRGGHTRSRTGPRDAALREARVCYNHLAGGKGLQLYDSLLARGFIEADGDALTLTAAGHGFVAAFGIDVAALTARRTPLCRACLDWSERRTHLAGSLGRAFLSEMLARGWARRAPTGRAIIFTASGAKDFDATFPPA